MVKIWLTSLILAAGNLFPLDQDPTRHAKPPCLSLFSPAHSTKLNAANVAVELNLDLDALYTTGAKCISLPSMPFVQLTDLQRSARVGDSQVWQAQLRGGNGQQALFTVRDQALSAMIYLDGVTWRVSAEPDGRHLLYAIDDQSFVVENPHIDEAFKLPNTAHDQDTPTAPLQPPVGPDAPTVLHRGVQDDGSSVDVLIAYTAAARDGAGGSDQINALIDAAIAQTNVAFQNSGIRPRVNLVHKVLTAYTESGSSSGDLAQLANKADGVLDEVHALRDTHAADLVMLIVETAPGCGISYIGSQTSAPSAGFGVVVRSCMLDNHSLAHEIGHAFGAGHDRGSIDTSASFAFGYGAPNSSFRTIMAYAAACKTRCSRIPYFSNPAISYNGQPTGVTEGTATGANNAKAINASALNIANYRAGVGSLSCVNLETLATGPGRISLDRQFDCNNNTQYISGTLVNVSAIPDTNASFGGWSGAVSGSAPSQAVLLNGSKQIAAKFDTCLPVTSAVTGGSGSVMITPAANCGNGSGYTPGTKVTFKAVLNPGSSFKQWSGQYTGTQLEWSTILEQPINVLATLDGCVTVFSRTVGAGSIDIAPPPNCENGRSYLPGTIITAKAIASTGTTFAGWDRADTTIVNPLIFAVNADTMLAARFGVAAGNTSADSAKSSKLKLECNPLCGIFLPMVQASGDAAGMRRTLAKPTNVVRTISSKLAYNDVLWTNEIASDESSIQVCKGSAGTSSVWFRLVPPKSGELKIETTGSNYATRIGVWHETGAMLQMIGCSQLAPNDRPANLALEVQQGLSYLIAVADTIQNEDGSNLIGRTGGRLQFRLEMTP